MGTEKQIDVPKLEGAPFDHLWRNLLDQMWGRIDELEEEDIETLKKTREQFQKGTAARYDEMNRALENLEEDSEAGR